MSLRPWRYFSAALNDSSVKWYLAASLKHSALLKMPFPWYFASRKKAFSNAKYRRGIGRFGMLRNSLTIICRIIPTVSLSSFPGVWTFTAKRSSFFKGLEQRMLSFRSGGTILRSNWFFSSLVSLQFCSQSLWVPTSTNFGRASFLQVDWRTLMQWRNVCRWVNGELNGWPIGLPLE